MHIILAHHFLIIYRIDIVVSFTLHLLNFRMQMRIYKCITRMKSRAFSFSLRVIFFILMRSLLATFFAVGEREGIKIAFRSIFIYTRPSRAVILYPSCRKQDTSISFFLSHRMGGARTLNAFIHRTITLIAGCLNVPVFRQFFPS